MSSTAQDSASPSMDGRPAAAEGEATAGTSPGVERKLSHDPSVTLEHVVESGGGDAEELRRCRELQGLLPAARPDQIVRFLRARKGNVQAAAKMLEKHLEWRAQNIVPALNPHNDEELKEELLKHKIVFFGTDMQGRKVVVLRGRLCGKHTYKDIEIARRALFQIGELMESRCEPLEKVTVLSSCVDLQQRNNDLDWLKEVAKLFQHNYPERLHAVHSGPTPFFVRAIWAIAKYFFDVDTREKVFLHANADAFLQFVPPHELHVELGGQATAPLSAEEMLTPVHVHIPASPGVATADGGHRATDTVSTAEPKEV